MSFRWLVVLLSPIALQAAPMETMAWHFTKMPSLGAFYGDATPQAEPPAATTNPVSCFTGQEDKLKDLSEPFRKYFHLGPDSWLVWNESRKLLVGHAMPITLWQVEVESDFKGQPTQLATTVTWYQGIEPGKPVPADAKPVHQATVIGRSGQKSLQTWTSLDSTRFISEKIEAGSTKGEDNQYIHSSFIVDWRESFNGGTYCWNYTGETPLSNESAKQVILAQVDSPAGGSWTLTAKASIVLADGQPVTKARLREVEGKEATSSEYPDFIATKELARIPVSGGEVLFQVFPAFHLFLNADNRPDEEADPFSATGARRIPDDIATGKEITKIPEKLKPWFPQFLLDVKDRVRNFGIKIPEDGLAGLETTTGQLFLAGLDSTELDKVSQMMTGSCNLKPHLIEVLDTFESSNKTNGIKHHRAFVLCQNGQRSLLSCNTEKKVSLIYFEIQSVAGDSDEFVDVHFYSKRASPTHEYSGSMTLPAGIEVKHSQITTESGDLLTESLKASVFRFSNQD